MEAYVFLLVFFPILFAPLYLLFKDRESYKLLSGILCLLATLTSIILTSNGELKITVSGDYYHFFEGLIVIFEIIITIYLFRVTIRHKRWTVLFLVIISTLLSIYTMFFVEKREIIYLNIDKLSLVMALLINIIGTLILVFSNEYISHYEEHMKIKSRQKFYYFVICIFLSAMNGIVFSDSLTWVYFFWEVTTLCSFLLISYNNDSEAVESGFRALFMNLIGGICFLAGIVLFKNMLGIDSLSQIIDNGRISSIQTIPVFLLCIAGFTKSAQLPFQSWLLGAMVAPTPVSALLHSSTMVKAGVFLIIKLSPAYAGTSLGTMITILGGLSFFICSVIAVTQRNAKRVLAYSTIANLGLIISSAGMGTSLAVSAAIMLIIFHAISKALLFLCAGQIEHVVGSRDIEDMTGLIRKAPILTILTAFGMLSMIVPPFGVLITKWISIESSVNNPLNAIFLVLGSAFTTVFWIKWLGTILAYPVSDLKPKFMMETSTYFPLGALGIGILAASIFITPIFNLFVSPEVAQLFNSQHQAVGNFGEVSSDIDSFWGAVILLVAAAAIFIYFFIRKIMINPTIKKIYLCGENSSISNTSLRFRTGDGTYVKPVVSNLYLSNIVKENTLTVIGYVVSVSIIIVVLTGGLL